MGRNKNAIQIYLENCMRFQRAKIITEIGLAVLGAGMILVAIFAYQLHIDHNQTWGTARVASAFLGGLALLFSILMTFSAWHRRLDGFSVIKKIVIALIWVGAPLRWLWHRDEQEEQTPAPDRTARNSAWLAVTGAGIAILLSLWFITSGRMVTWTPSTTYFDKLADGFLAGKLSLLETPPAALVELTDPYSYQNRRGIGDYIWDASLYQGKYYYYWGPVPALLAAGVKTFGPIVVQDQFLVMAAIIGLAIVLAALFHWLRKTFFPAVPAWIILIIIPMGVLNTPVFWLVNFPTVYEVPIALGQFFLVLGLFAILRGMANENLRLVWLTAAGFCWGASIGSRANNVAAIGWMTGLAILYFMLKTKRKWAWVGEAATLLVPLAIWGGGLAWYNYARFGNILETGHRYQLSRPGLPVVFSQLFSFSYVLPNLYNLLARPMVVNWQAFPFFFTPYISNSMWPKLIFYPRNPNYYYTEPIAGIFVAISASWLIFLPVMALIRDGWRWLHEQPVRLVKLREWPVSTWAGWMAAGGVVCNLAVLTLFVTTSMRYEADVTVLLTVLIGICIGWTTAFLNARPRLQKSFLWVSAALCILSIIISLLINFQNVGNIFVKSNPQLYSAIAHFFNGR